MPVNTQILIDSWVVLQLLVRCYWGVKMLNGAIGLSWASICRV